MQTNGAANLAIRLATLLSFSSLCLAQQQNVGAVGRGVSISFQNSGGSSNRGVSIGFQDPNAGTLSVSTNLSTATFTIAGPVSSYTGIGTSFTQANAPVGSYTITYAAQSCFAAPITETKFLTAGGTLTFSGTYEGRATLAVNVTPSAAAANATFSINPAVLGLLGSGPYPRTLSNVVPQTYTVTFSALAGFQTPAPQTVAPSQSCALTFAGSYSASGCSYSATPQTTAFGQAGGQGSIAVVATPNSASVPVSSCTWNASSTDPWITGITPASSAGSGTVSFNISANPGTTVRSGSLSVAGKSISVSQSALLITTLSLPDQNVGEPYFAQLASTLIGGQWSADSSLPPGLTLEPTTGRISGGSSTAVKPGVYSFRASYTYSGQTVSQPLQITAKCDLSSKIIPVLKQSDVRWGSQLYDSTIHTIAGRGCALTTLAMAFGYVGQPTDPQSLNKHMVDNGNFRGDGNVDWDSTIADYGQNLKWEKGPGRITSTENMAAAQSFLDSALCAADPHPVIVGVKGGAGRFPGHFVLVDGRITNADGSAKYLIANPASSSRSSLDDYANEYQTRGYVHDPVGDLSRLNFYLDGDVEAIITDPSGRQTGFDSVKSQVLQNIPQSAYFVDALDGDDSPVEAGVVSRLIEIFQPIPGVYTAKVVGGSKGSYTLRIHPYSVDGKRESRAEVNRPLEQGASASFLTNFSSIVGSESPSIEASVTVPSVVSLTPATSVGATQTLSIQFSHPSGYQTLSVMNALINTALDGRHGCYIAYSLQANTLYLINDNGDAGGPYAGALTLNGSGSVSNSQCTILGSGTSATGSGTNLTLTLNMTFTTGFSGNKVVYLAARDTALNNTGWQTMGVLGVPPLPTTFPNPVSMTPPSASTSNVTLAFAYQDTSSALNLQTAWALINTAIDGRAACYVAYYRPGNLILLFPDNGDGTQATSMVLTGTSSLSNSQCTVSAQGSSFTTSGNQMTVNLNIALKPAFTGPKAVWMAVQTVAPAQTSPWQALGALRVP